jgi:hypothetical protein
MAAERRTGQDPEITRVIKVKGRVVRLAKGVADAVPTRRVERLDLSLEGIAGDRHAGFVRPADSRVPWYRRGELIHNERQISLVAMEELAEIAAVLGLPGVEPEWLGANVAVEGVTAFSALPRGTRIVASSGAVLAVTDQNVPCRLAGRALAEAAGADDALALSFVEAARRRRGVVAYVDRAGPIAEGDTLALRVPEQWIWRP